MRILFCTNSIGARGGIERVTIVKANALAEIIGNEVAIAFTDKGTYPEDTIHPLSDKVKVYDLGVPFWDLFPLNIKNLCLTAPSKFWKLRKSLKRLIREFNPDVIISTGSYEKFAIASLRLKNRVKIREYHFNSNYRDYISPSRLLRLAGWFDNKVLCHFFDKNYLLTKEDKYTNFPNDPKFDYQYNPCSFSVLDESAVERENVVIAIGRLVEEKNFSSLLRVWGRMKGDLGDWQLWIVGDGNLSNLLHKQAQEFGIGHSVKFLGFRKDVPMLLSKSKILAMTSKHEGFGLSIVEAMRCGVVPVSFNTPCGPNDIISDGKDGILVDYNDEAQFADKLYSLMSDESALSRMSEAASLRAKDFDVDAIARQWMIKYTNLLNK